MEKRQSGKIHWITGAVMILVATSAGIMTGCSKDGGVCVSPSGPMTKQVRIVADFSEIMVNDNVNLILTTDSAGPVVVEAGSNLIGGIKTTVGNGALTLSNTNACNWLRDYSKPVNVYISAQKVWRVKYNGSGDISTSGTLKLDSLTIEVWGGCGTIDVALDIWQGNFSMNAGTVDFRLRGVSAITSVYSGDYGLFDARNLQTGFTFITNRGSNDCYVKVTTALEAKIESIGNIYYTGSPASVTTTITGTGKVIPF
jgi:hypothetical protein